MANSPWALTQWLNFLHLTPLVLSHPQPHSFTLTHSALVHLPADTLQTRQPIFMTLIDIIREIVRHVNLKKTMGTQ